MISPLPDVLSTRARPLPALEPPPGRFKCTVRLPVPLLRCIACLQLCRRRVQPASPLLLGVGQRGPTAALCPRRPDALVQALEAPQSSCSVTLRGLRKLSKDSCRGTHGVCGFRTPVSPRLTHLTPRRWPTEKPAVPPAPVPMPPWVVLRQCKGAHSPRRRKRSIAPCATACLPCCEEQRLQAATLATAHQLVARLHHLRRRAVRAQARTRAAPRKIASAAPALAAAQSSALASAAARQPSALRQLRSSLSRASSPRCLQQPQQWEDARSTRRSLPPPATLRPPVAAAASRRKLSHVTL